MNQHPLPLEDTNTQLNFDPWHLAPDPSVWWPIDYVWPRLCNCCLIITSHVVFGAAIWPSECCTGDHGTQDPGPDPAARMKNNVGILDRRAERTPPGLIGWVTTRKRGSRFDIREESVCVPLRCHSTCCIKNERQDLCCLSSTHPWKISQSPQQIEFVVYTSICQI